MGNNLFPPFPLPVDLKTLLFLPPTGHLEGDELGHAIFVSGKKSVRDNKLYRDAC